MSVRLRTCLRCVRHLPRRPISTTPGESPSSRGWRSYWKYGAATLVVGGAVQLLVSLNSQSSEEKKFNELKKSIGGATMHLHQSESGHATPHFDRAMEIVAGDIQKRKQDDPIPSEKYVYLLDQLGNIALTLERYHEAAQLYQATIDGLALNNIPRNSRKITELFLKMGQIYAIVTDYTQAELSFLHVIEVTTAELRKPGPPNRDVIHLNGLAFEGLGKIYVSMGQTENALHMYRYSIEFARSSLGQDDAHIPVLLSDMAFTYQKMGRLKEALAAASEAVELSSKNNPMVYQVILCNKATILSEMGELEEADKLYSEALKIARQKSDWSTIQEVMQSKEILKNNKKVEVKQDI